MGSNAPKSALDREYRALAARFLETLMDRHKLNKGKIAEALGVDRSVASRYLSRAVRPPLQRLAYLERTLGETVPPEISEAFWLSDGSPSTAAEPLDIENAIRDLGRQLTRETSDEAKAAAKRELEGLLRKLA